MSDAKVSAFTAASAASGSQEIGVNESGTTKKVTVDQIKTYANTAPVFAAGSATAGSWPTFTNGTLLTTPEDGALEVDGQCWYGCTDAGNRGVIPIEHFIRLVSTRTFTSNTNAQAIFNSPANGKITIAAGTYLFEALVAITTMSATSGNGKFGVLGAGTATLANVYMHMFSLDIAIDTATNNGGSWTQSVTTGATNMGTAGTGASLSFMAKGTFEVSSGGTIIPSFTMTTAASAVAQIGSYFRCHRIGAAGVDSVGQWT